MASNARAVSRFALVVALKAALIGALAFAAFLALSRAHYYATALILLAAAALVAFSLLRTARTADRLYADFVDSIAAGAFDTPTTAAARHFPALGEALNRASERLTRDRRGQARRAQELDALLDTLDAALFIVHPAGDVRLANRAARALAGEAVKRLADVAAIGPGAAARLTDLGVGAREIVLLADGRRMLAAVALFRGAEDRPQRLISLQSLSGELSAVENQAWQDLVRVLSHEMMNSLTPVVSLSESLQRLLAAPAPRASQEAQVAADVIARRSAGLMRFVERYRRIAEIAEPQLRCLPLDPLLGELDRLVVEYAGGRMLAYHRNVDPANLTVRADPDLLQQALINLLKNAVEAVADTVDPRIDLNCHAQGHRILIDVCDNGTGLPEHGAEQVFTPFFTTKTEGSGIGLAVARQIAIAHGGELTARRLPQGAIFRLALPLGDRDLRFS